MIEMYVIFLKHVKISLYLVVIKIKEDEGLLKTGEFIAPKQK